MSLAHVCGQDLSLHSVSNYAPILLVVADDICVRESLDLLIRCKGWQPEIFESPQEFLAWPRPLVPSCLVLDVSFGVLASQACPYCYNTGYGSPGTRCGYCRRAKRGKRR